MNKKKIMLGLFGVGALSISSLLLVLSANNNSSIVKGTDSTIWYHYGKVDASESRHGSKEFWASCSNLGHHEFAAPSTGEIREGVSFDSTDYFNELDIFDDRYIAPTSYGEMSDKDWVGAFGDYGLLFNARLTVRTTTFQYNNKNIKENAFQFGKMSYYDPNTGLTTYVLHEDDSIDYYAKKWTPINDGTEYTYEKIKITESLYSYLSSYNIYRSFSSSDFTYSDSEHIYKLNKAQVAIESDSPTQLYCTKCYIGFKNGQIDEIEYTLSDGNNPIKTIWNQYILNTPTIDLPDIPE